MRTMPRGTVTSMGDHCCEEMRTGTVLDCEVHTDPQECPDVLVRYVGRYNEYGLPVRDGGESYVVISFCPWCGTRLPKSKRRLWFAELEKQGITDMDDPRLPAAFRSDAWWRS